MKYEPKPEDFDVVSFLGRCCGQIGMVLLAKHRQKSLVAVKKFDLEKADHKDVLQIQARFSAINHLELNSCISNKIFNSTERNYSHASIETQ